MAPLRGSGDETRLVSARCVLESCGRTYRFDPDDVKGSSFPFCSPFCRGVDLGCWVNEEYRVPAEDHEDPDGDAEAKVEEPEDDV